MRRALLSIGALCLLAFLVAFLLERSAWKAWMLRGLERMASRSLGLEVRADALSLGLREGLLLKGLRVKTDRAGPEGQREILAVEEIRALPRWRSLVKGRVILDSVQIASPVLRIGQDGRGNWVFPDLAFPGGPGENSSGKSFPVGIRLLALEKGRVTLEGSDEPLVDHLRVHLQNFSTASPERGTLEVSAEIFSQGKIDIQGWIEAGATPMRGGGRFSSTGVSLDPWKKWFALHGIPVESARVGWDLALEGNSEEGVSARGQIVAGDLESCHLLGPVRETLVKVDLFYSFKESSLRATSLEIEADDVLRARFAGMFPDLKRGALFEGILRVDRIDLSRIRPPGEIRLAGFLSADSLAIKREKSEGMPTAEGVARIQAGCAAFRDFTLAGAELEIGFFRHSGMSLKTLKPASFIGARDAPFVRPVWVRLAADAVLEEKGVRAQGRLGLGGSEVRLGRQSALSWKGAEWRIRGNLDRNRAEARLDGTIEGLHCGDLSFPSVSTGLVLERSDRKLALRQVRIEGKGFSLSAGAVTVEESGKKEKAVARLERLAGVYSAAGLELKGGEGEIAWALRPGPVDLGWNFSCKEGRAEGVPFAGLATSGRVQSSGFQGSFSVRGADSGTIRMRAKGRGPDKPFPIQLEIQIDDWDLKNAALPLLDRLGLGMDLSGRVRRGRFDGSVAGPDEITGRLVLDATGLSAARKETGRFLFKDLALKGEAAFQGADASGSLSADCGAVHARVTGTVKSFGRPGRAFSGHVSVAPVELAALRETFWDLTPDAMLYMGLEGTASAEIDFASGDGAFGCEGSLAVEEVRLQGEYGQFAVGPVNGRMPLLFSSRPVETSAEPVPDFTRSAYESLLESFESSRAAESGSQTITIGGIAVGFPFVENIELSLRSQEGCVRIDRIVGDVFGGRIYGQARVRADPAPRFELGLLARGVRLSSLCDAIRPIQGYLSGCVDGTLRIDGSAGAGLKGLSGRAEFWSYGEGCEKTRISRQLLEKIAGRSMPMLFRDRPYDRGVLTVLVNKGFMVFQELEISNKNLIGMTDLSVRVAPQNNRIAVDHLMSSLAAAAERARNAQTAP